MVNLEWYRTFKAIYQTGSLTAAAKMLFISQPNVSQHLSSLEAHVGKPLFERKPRLVPTDHGKLFYTQVVEPLEKLENVEAAFKEICLKKQKPTIRLGAVKEYFYGILSGDLNKVAANFTVSFGLTQDLLGKLQKGELDFVIATQITESKQLVFEPIIQESFVIVGNKEIDTSGFRKEVKRGEWEKVESWLLAQTWFAYSADLAIIRRFWQKNFGKRPAIKPSFIIPDMHVILKALHGYQGLTVTAEYVVKPYLLQGDLQVIWKGRALTENTLYLAYDKTGITSDQVRLMQKFVGIKGA